MAREYVPIGLIKIKSTTSNIYNSMRENDQLNKSALYITTDDKTIKEMSPFNINLNYSTLTGFLNVDSSYSEEELISNGFAKINVSEDEQQSLVKKSGNMTDKFIVRISPTNNYFNLFVPVIDDIE